MSVAVVAKLLGAKWKALTDDEREQYKKQAAHKCAEEQQQADQVAQPMEGVENEAMEVSLVIYFIGRKSTRSPSMEAMRGRANGVFGAALVVHCKER